MALPPDKIQALAHQASTYACQALLNNDRWQEVRDQKFAELVEAEALEEAAQAVEKATYRKRWAKAAVNGQARNVPPCELSAAIRALKEAPPQAA